MNTFFSENSDSETEEVDNLYREATMPLDEVMAQYTENPQIARCKKEKVCILQFCVLYYVW